MSNLEDHLREQDAITAAYEWEFGALERVLAELRKAIAIYKQPHYGDTGTQLDHASEAFDVVERVVALGTREEI